MTIEYLSFKSSLHSNTYIVPGVHRRPALQQEVDGGDAGEVADGVAADTGGVPGAGQVQGGGPAPPLGPHHHELVHCLLHVVDLQQDRDQEKNNNHEWEIIKNEMSFCNYDLTMNEFLLSVKGWVS